MRTDVVVDPAPSPPFRGRQIVTAEPFLFLAGFHGVEEASSNLPVDLAGSVLAEPEAVRQSRLLYDRLEGALADVSSSIHRIVQLTQWTRTFVDPGPRPGHRNDPYEEYWPMWRPVVDSHLKVRNERLVRDRPPSAFLPVDRLLSTDRLVELQGIALTDGSGYQPQVADVDVPASGGFSRAMMAGPWVITAGFGATDSEARLRADVRAPDNIWYGNQTVAETTATLERLRRLVCDAGLEWEHVVKATLYLSPTALVQLPAINAEWSTYWDGPGPARAVVPVSGIGVHDLNVEIELIVARAGTGWEPQVVETGSGPHLGPVPTAVRSGSLLLFSTLATGAPRSTDDRYPYLHREVASQLQAIKRTVKATGQTIGAALRPVKVNLFLQDFAELPTALHEWDHLFGRDPVAGGVFECPPFSQQLDGSRLLCDLIAEVS
jgi:enamine deaminase RidA (YjgF/YER057c/UK114 family)